MRQNHFETVALIDARPEAVYAALADYQHAHAQLLPRAYLSDLVVEEGGQGEGTMIRYRMRIFGFTRTIRARVHEPEPGRILVERDITSTRVTTFAVTPANNGQQAHVQIAAHWEPAYTPWGALEQAFYPTLLQHIFTQQLDLLAKFVGHQQRRHQTNP
ncbi:SRPBCC family protein [Dictyobacter arantiisoli]|uniref:Polyketide cyclase n=1 Tax=Dictyobacter arantiisoli TaxID=2014874 RepID=A0A5A5THR7_9CHLR|nr:SRPBCC family protein [Dictyobacter arantiisoli]GCF11130.1 hypothetical protein KDI_46940 [Dictyobacter arantiisoli]